MKNKKTPMLDPKVKNEQDIEKQDSPAEPNSKPDTVKKPEKDDAEDVPESNDPVGYSEPKSIKKSPYKKD
ncbi:hypothetical protein [Aequorivita xiaoshiensis]|uniref:Uncharacterized protein n=1 Tax=Aequorivita xiaoshiensis TaxID=2874476 RepID=A0A9X1R2B9_9FLAO|nr:hypothetical protein [Aequorivita xiaoshiensis]MCG2431021.1 hypothetical protein [Aequorivita xiaoshiensis]